MLVLATQKWRRYCQYTPFTLLYFWIWTGCLLLGSVAALLVKCVIVKQGAKLISPSLLANIPKCSKECHKRFRLDMGEWTESNDDSSTESEAPKLNPPKKSWSLVCQRKAKKIDENLYLKVQPPPLENLELPVGQKDQLFHVFSALLCNPSSARLQYYSLSTHNIHQVMNDIYTRNNG